MANTKKSIKQLEAQWQETFNRIADRRERDSRVAGKGKGNNGAFLTQDLLRKRQKLTQGGTAKLVLDYGIKNPGKVEFTLSDLNKMAEQIKRTQKEFHGRQKGVAVPDLIAASATKDKQAAKNIAAATLYKFVGDVLYFRVTSSGETFGAPSHYLVRVRLDEWNQQINKFEGSKYIKPAQNAARGRVSFDCNCGRHQFWYRYLATIGGFALAPPKENVYPKIRNPKLAGACCKHTLKTLLTLQTAAVQGRIAKEMEAEAKRHGFADPVEKMLSAADITEMEKAGAFNTLGGFQKFTKAMKAFEKKKKTPQAKKAFDKLKKDSEAKMKELAMQKKAAETVAKKEIAARRELEKQAVSAKRAGYIAGLQTLKALGMLNDAGYAAMANTNGTTVDALRQIAKEEGIE